MKIVIIGGYGVFGALTAQLLIRDGHQVWLAGRRPHTALGLASKIGAETLAVDIHRAPDVLFDVAPDVVIDAAGPFQQYGDHPYAVPQLCIEHGCHYLDLSDSSAFTGGISTLNEQAESAGVVVMSGASSVPGLSSIIVDDLIQGLDTVDEIDIAILPGNRAPRGLSVIKSVLSGVGRPVRAKRNGIWQDRPGWTDRKVYNLAPDLKRAGYLVDVPDLHLLPQRTGAASVTFRAGLELPLMNGSLALLAKLRRYARLELPEAALTALLWLSKALYPFGSDRGGMQVSVTGMAEGQSVARCWTLIAEHGDGPFVPGILCRALIRQIKDIRPGARACLGELPKAAVEQAMADLAITTRCTCNHQDPAPQPSRPASAA